MQFKSNKGYSSVGQLGMLLLFLGVGLVLTTIMQMIIGIKITPPGTPLEKIGEAMLQSMKDPQNVSIIRILQITSTCFMFFIPAFLFSLVCNGKELFWIGFNKYFNGFQVLIGFLIIFAANIMASPLQELSEKIISNFYSLNLFAIRLEEAYNEQVVLLSNLKGVGDLVLALIIMAFFPALFEELFFRGALQTILVKWWKKPIIAILVTSIIFSLIHMSIYLFLSRVALGFVLGLLFYKTKNIWVNTIAHFLNNALAVLQMYTLSNAKEKIDVSKLDPHFDWWIGVLAIFVLIALFNFLNKYTSLNVLKINAKETQLLSNRIPDNPFEGFGT